MSSLYSSPFVWPRFTTSKNFLTESRPRATTYPWLSILLSYFWSRAQALQYLCKKISVPIWRNFCQVQKGGGEVLDQHTQLADQTKCSPTALFPRSEGGGGRALPNYVQSFWFKLAGFCWKIFVTTIAKINVIRHFLSCMFKLAYNSMAITAWSELIRLCSPITICGILLSFAPFTRKNNLTLL